MENFLGKVIKIVSGDKGVSKDYWVDDSKVKACYECESAFNQWNRRHHCRICGRVFCGNCTRNSIPPPRESADQQWLRVCNYCFRVRQRNDQPVPRVQQHHAVSRGVGSAVLSKSGGFRQPLEGMASVSGALSSDGSAASLASSRMRAGSTLSRWSRSQSTVHRVSSGDLSWSVPPPLEDDFGMSLADRDARLLYQQQLEAGTLPSDAPPQANSLAEVHRHLLAAAADAHLRAVVQQLLMVESVPQPEVWAPIVSSAAQAVAAYLSPPQMYANGQHDPRQSLKVKKVADVGQPEDTCVVTGVVVRKGLVHRKMRSYIEYPKVLLLAGSLEYQRETNKLSSFDLMDHDKQYLANAVARLAVVKPDVLLVEGSVARMAQEDLLSRNISVAQKIKSKVLERLARCMGVRVTPTVEHLSQATAHQYLGDCKVFRVEAETVVVPPAPATSPPPGAAAAPAPGRDAAEPHTGVASSDAGRPAGAAASSESGSGASPVASAPQPGQAAAAPLSTMGSTDAQAANGSNAATQLSSGAGTRLAQAPPSLQQQQQAPPVRPLSEGQQPGYTSLSAAMMMKALGSGPNAAAAVACVSGGSGVTSSAVIPFVTRVGAAASASAAPNSGPPGGDGRSPTGAAAASTAAATTSAAAAAAGPAPAFGRPGALAPIPAGPPAPPQVTLMYFEGCRPTTATVLLKGAGVELLKKLKPVLGFAVLTAWNQRLESAFLTDLLTAAVASAGEEAYASAFAQAAAFGCGGSGGLHSFPTFSSTASLPPLGCGPAPPLSLSFFRTHAEQAVRASVAAASASGAPGILLSISPHCNAWDDSLIAEWEQQGFAFPHLHPHAPQLLTHTAPPQPLLPQRPAVEDGTPGPDTAAASKPAGGAAGGQGDPAASDAQVVAEGTVDPAGPSTPTAAGASAGPGNGADAAEPPEAEATLTCSKDQAPQTGVCAGADAGGGQPQPAAAVAGAGTSAPPAAAGPPPAHTPTGSEGDSAAAAAVVLSVLTMDSPFAVSSAHTAAVAASSGPSVAPAEAGHAADSCQAAAAAAAGAAEVARADAPGVQAPTAAATAGATLAQGEARGAVGAASVEERPPPSPHVGDSGAAGGQQQQGEQVPEQQVQKGEDKQPAAPQQTAVMVLQGQRIYNHQRIFVTCMFRRSRDRNLCDPFQVKQIDFYHRSSDVPLIRYIKMCTQLGWTCPGAGCPEPFTAHESVFFFGSHRLTIFYSTLPPIQALPGEEKNQVWHWTRPIGRGQQGAGSCRRIPLSQDACYISMGRFLELSFSADGLDVFGRSLHYDHVRYFGLGRTLVCMFPERTNVYVMQLPDVVMSYSQQAQTKWLRQEGAELAQEANDAFGLIELVLRDSPHYGAGGGGGGDSAVGAVPIGGGGGVAGSMAELGAAGDAGGAPGSSPGGGVGMAYMHAALAGGGAATAAAAAAAAAAAGPSGTSAVLAQMLMALQKDRTSFLALVDDCLARNTPPAPNPFLPPHQQQSAAGGVPWDEQIIASIRELNRLRSVLAKAVLQWAARLQDPAGFAVHYSRAYGASVGSGRVMYRTLMQPQHQASSQPHQQLQLQAPPAPPPPSQQPQPQHGASSSSPHASAATSVVAASTSVSDLATISASTFRDPPSFAGNVSEGSVSLFSSVSPVVAAYRLGLVPGPPPQVASSAPSVTGAGGEAVSNAAGTEHATEHQTGAVDTTSHVLPIPIVPHTNGPLAVHAVAEMVAHQETRGGGAELLEGSRSLLGASSGGGGAAAAAPQLISRTETLRGLGASRRELAAGAAELPPQPPPGQLAAAAAGAPPPPSTGLDGGAVARVPAGLTAAALAAAGSAGSSKRLSAMVRLSAGGGMIPGLDGAAHPGAALGAAAGGVPVVASGAGGSVRGSSLPRSASVSTIGDMGDLSYMGGIGGDSGLEDNDENDGREGQDDEEWEEEPDHDTFLAFMGSGPRSGAARFRQAGTSAAAGVAGGSGNLAEPSGEHAAGDSGDEDAEVADGGYYYRALFSHSAAAGPSEAGVEDAQSAVSLQQQQQQQPQSQGQTAGMGLGLAVKAPTTAVASAAAAGPGGNPFLPAAAAATSSATHAHGATAAVALTPHLPHPAAAAAVAVTASGPAGTVVGTATAAGVAALAAEGGAGPLIGLQPSHAALDSAVAASEALVGTSRRQLLGSMRRRLESAGAAAATPSGGTLARGFVPLPGRATLPPGVNDTIITLFDDEPTSIIAYALSTRSFQQQINAGYKAIFGRARAEGGREQRDRDVAVPAAAGAGPTVTVDPSHHNQQQQQQQQPCGAAPNGGDGGAGAAGVSGLGSLPQAQQVQPSVAGPAAPVSPRATATAAAAAASASAWAPPTTTSSHATGASASAGAQPPAPAAGPSLLQPPSQPPAQQPPQQPHPAAAPPPFLAASPDADWWTVLTSKEACHVRVAFEDDARTMPWARAKFSVTAHFAPQFAELRRRCIQGGEAAFVASMCRCKRWESRGGKSNAYFAKTRDDRYIIKSLSKSEKASFMNFAPHYFSHMGRHLLNRDSPTCLAKILGVYSVAFKPQPAAAGVEGGGGGGAAGSAAGAALIKELKEREFSQDLLVMENCFYDRPVARIYDLKGSERNRFNADAASRPEDRLEVHLDDNLRRAMHTNPIFVDARSRHQMEAAVWADTSFLAGQDVMDYSLLVGVDKENGVLALAIIDFIRQYTWDKQLETWVKSSGMLGGNGKEPTIISPKQYMRRFRAAMQQYFVSVPGSAGSEVPKDPDAIS